MRIGHGYDVHKLVEGRKLIIGGVNIPYDKGLLGHSDADVLLHAVSDALLGAEIAVHGHGRQLSQICDLCHSGLINAVFSRLTSGEIGTGKTLTVNCSVSLVAAGIGSPVPLAYNLQEDGIYEYMVKMLRSGAEF